MCGAERIICMKVVDMHCDTISALLAEKRAGKEAGLKENDCHVDILKMQKGGYLLQNFALFVDMGACADPWEEVRALLALYQEEMAANQEWIVPVLTWSDIEKNRAEGRMSAMLTVEEGGVCLGSLAKLEELYGQGVRMLTLMWNYPNGLGHPNLNRYKGKEARLAAKEKSRTEAERLVQQYLNTPDTENGLTDAGAAFVQRMEELGMIIDVSHMSDAGFYQVLSLTKKPFVASHSNARAVCPCVRNLSDDMIRRLAERGGVTGLNFCADFLTQAPYGEHNPGTIAAVVNHAKHIVNVGGMECLGLGSDFDGIDTHAELTGADKMENLWSALKESGFTERELDKIWGGNVLRLYREVLTEK